MGIAITYAIANLAVLGLFFYVTYRMTRKQLERYMTRNKNVGNAGEFYVLAQLAQRGYIAGKTDDGQTLIDVIATDEETLRTVNIQVKSTLSENVLPSWLMNKKNEQVHEGLWYVFVHVNSAEILPDFYMFHSSEIGKRIAEEHAAWLSEPKKNGETRKDSNTRQFIPTAEELENHKGNWEKMFEGA